MAISLIACLILAVAGQSTFTSNTKANLLNNFDSNDGLINLARFSFAVNMFTTYPMELFVARHVLEDYMFPSSARTPLKRHVAWTLGLVISSTIVALAVQDLSVVLEITGGLSATALAYVLPPFCWMKLSSSYRVACIACIAFGSMVMVLSLLQTLMGT
jgi:sodium-coupled neutral amino acid transporter 11